MGTGRGLGWLLMDGVVRVVWAGWLVVAPVRVVWWLGRRVLGIDGWVVLWLGLVAVIGLAATAPG
jgi:hypothetical protein